jgi:predicted phage replisome organizer
MNDYTHKLGSEKMAEVKWIKLSTNMFEDEKIRLIESLPEADTILIIWVKLLAQAGKTNATGYIYLNENIPFTDEMLATIFNRPIGTVRLALKTFEQFGMIEISYDHFISISNWEKHQNIDGLEKIRQDTKKRVQKHREKQKQLNGNSECNVTVTHGNETEEEEEREVEKEITTTTTNPIVYFEKSLCRLSTIQSNKLYAWLDDFSGKAEILNEAIDIADNRNKRTFGFVEFLLKEWANSKLDSLDRVRAYEQEKFNKQKPVRTGKYNKPIRQEHIPDHMDEPYKPKQVDPGEEEAKKRAIEEKLKQFRK